MTQPRSTLPAEKSIIREQLIVHSDFHLPRQHRILDDLTARRYEIASELQIPLSDEPIHIFLFEDEARFRQFMDRQQPQFPNRRAFFVSSDTQLTVYAYWGQRVAEDLRHEVTHGYLHAVVPKIPLWMDEGIAEFFEVERGTDGINRPHVDLLIAEYKAGNWRPNLERLESLSATAAMTQLDYAEAWLWIHFLLRTDAQTNSMLCQSLQSCRSTGVPESVSDELRAYLPQCEIELVRHLSNLRK